jgi:hypothetical protein
LIGACFSAVLLAAAVNPRMAKADISVFVAGNAREFGTLDLNTGVFTQIGTLNTPLPILGMGFGSDGNLYGLDGGANAHLFRIDTSNANATDLGPVGQSTIDATADAAGKLFVLSQDPSAVFYTMNPPSTSITTIGTTGHMSSGLGAVTANGMHLFTDVGTDLYSINVNNGAATLVGGISFTLFNGLFVHGTLYGFDPNGAIVTVNTTTGAGTQVGTYSLPNMDFVDASAVRAGQIGVPEPSTLAVAGLGLLSVIGCALKRGITGHMSHNGGAG